MLSLQKWWTDLWLKEGFAMFMEFLFIYHNYPDFKVKRDFKIKKVKKVEAPVK